MSDELGTRISAALYWDEDVTDSVTRCGLCTDGDADIRRDHSCDVEDFWLNHEKSNS